MTAPGSRHHDATGRSTGRRKRDFIEGQFAPRLIEMLESPAYRVLSLSAHRFLARLEIELAHHGGADNGRLPVTFDDFETYGIDRHAIAPAQREVAALGFVDVTERGRAGNGEFRTPTHYRLTYRTVKGQQHATHEWRRFETVEAAQAAARMARTPIARSRKNKMPVGNLPKLQWGKPTLTEIFPMGEFPTTGRVGESPTTLDISGP